MKKGGSAKGLVSQIDGARQGVRSVVAIVGGAIATHLATTSEMIEATRVYIKATHEQWVDLIDACDNLVVAHVKWAETIDYDLLAGTVTRTERKVTKKEALKEEGAIPENTH